MVEETIQPIKGRGTTWLARWLSTGESGRFVNCAEGSVKSKIRPRKEDSSLYNKSWAMHDTKAVWRKHPSLLRWWHSCPLAHTLWTLWERNCSKSHSKVLFYTVHFILITIWSVLSSIKYWSLSLHARNSPSVAVYSARSLWITWWGKRCVLPFTSVWKLRHEKINEL